MVIEDRISKTLRYFAVFLGILTLVYVFLAPETGAKWLLPLGLWLFFILGIMARNWYVYRAMYRNFSTLAAQASGIVKPGGIIFFAPPGLSFTYKERRCRLGYLVDSMLDCLFEYVVPVEREIEIKFTRLKGADLGRKFKVSGEDSRMAPFLTKDPAVYAAIDSLLSEFSEFYVGKDRKIRLIGPALLKMSRPQDILARFDKAILLAGALEEIVKEK